MPLLSQEPALLDTCLRAERPDDREFLERLFIAVRWAEFDNSGWPDEFRRRFLADQFALQSTHYATHYDGASFEVVERNGIPIGRLYIFEGKDEIRIVDISLLPEVSGAGIGTALLKSVLRQAQAARKILSIHVEQFNPARRLYQRLGFEEISADGPYIRMERRPVL